jgi:hypothetical protein
MLKFEHILHIAREQIDPRKSGEDGVQSRGVAHLAYCTRTNRSRAGAGAEENSRAAVVVEDPRGSGKKRGAAVIVGEEEGRRLWGEEGRQLLSSGKKRGVAVVVEDPCGSGKKSSGRRS